MEAKPEVWLRGPVAGVHSLLQPVAHALLQAREDFARVVPGLSDAELWRRPPGGGASAGFHVKHAAGSLDRLMTYARGEELSAEQRARLEHERDEGESATALLRRAEETIDAALAQLREIDGGRILESRAIGRAMLPTTLLGVLVHAGEHTARHVGQLITTVSVIRGIDSESARSTPH